MAGYIGANTSSVTNNQNAAERRKKFTFTAATTVLSGLSFLPDKIHIFHNGIRLVKNTDFTEAADGQSVTLVNAAQAGDEIVAVTFEQNPAIGGGSSYTDADVDARLLKTGNILPNADNTSDLGSATKRFNELYVGGGIVFGDASAASVSSETLDAYEEGTFTGQIDGYYGSPTTAVTSTGHYTKIGNTVSFWIMFENVNTTGASGNMWMTGLPFASNGGYAIQTVQMSVAGTFGTNSGPFGLVSGTILYFYYHVNQASTAAVFHNAGTGRYIRCSGTYRIA